MKRYILIIASVLALLLAGAVFAQSPQNTTAPGPTQQQEPGQTNNNLPNPGNPVQVGPQTTPPVQEQGTVEGTATESLNNNQGANTTGQVTGTTGTTTGTQDTTMTHPHPETESTNTPVDVDVDTGNRANGAVDVDVSTKPDADTNASGMNETGETGSYNGTAGDNGSLPNTASELPTVALIGLLALGAVFALRVKRNA